MHSRPHRVEYVVKRMATSSDVARGFLVSRDTLFNEDFPNVPPTEHPVV